MVAWLNQGLSGSHVLPQCEMALFHNLYPGSGHQPFPVNSSFLQLCGFLCLFWCEFPSIHYFVMQILLQESKGLLCFGNWELLRTQKCTTSYYPSFPKALQSLSAAIAGRSEKYAPHYMRYQETFS